MFLGLLLLIYHISETKRKEKAKQEKMPFSNVTAEEAKAISEFTERRTSRTRMTFIGGHKGFVEKKEEMSIKATTPYLDYVTGVVEALIRRYALTCIADTTADVVAEDPEKGKASAAAAAAAAQSSGERPYPFPSLFLHTPRQVVEMQDVVMGQSRAAFHSINSVSSAADLKDVHCTSNTPPLDLLYTVTSAAGPEGEAARARNADVAEATGAPQTVPAPLPCDTANRFPPELRRNCVPVQLHPSLRAARRMVNVSLTPAATSEHGSPTQQMVQVVLQAEAGLVVAAAPPAPPLPPVNSFALQNEEESSDERVSEHRQQQQSIDEAAVREAPFLLSPDATSCVLVACRVTLLPALQDLLSHPAAEQHALSTLQSAFPRDAMARSRFLRACVRTATAGMVHLDRSHGVASTLRAMVWDSAVPAYVHAVHRHYELLFPGAHKEAIGPTAKGEGERKGPASALQFLQETLRAVCSASCFTEKLRSDIGMVPSQESSLLSSGALPVLHVDWYVVGGIRMKEYAEPVLKRVFRAFFPPPPPPASAPPSPNSTPPSALLQEEFELDSLLCTSSAACATSQETADTLRVVHRLREDGQCFWSFNTTFQSWCVDENGQQRYAYPMTWGLLLSVATGHCWPAAVQPGTRMIPLREVRNFATVFGYRWITPRESDTGWKAQRHEKPPPQQRKAKKRNADASEDDKTCDAAADHGEGLTVMCNAVPSNVVVQRMAKAASAVSPEQRLWSPFHVCGTTLAAAPPSLSKRSLTLASYVRTVLARQEAWWTRRLSLPAATAATAQSYSSPPQRVLPLLIRRYYTRSEAAHGQDSTAEDEDKDAGGDEEAVVNWDRVPLTEVKSTLTQPIVSFLGWSTTPHCEPPDFCELVRDQLLWRTSVGSSDLLVEDTDGLYIE